MKRRNYAIITVIFTMVFVATFVIKTESKAQAAEKTNLDKLNIYLDTKGKDTNSGIESTKPVKTLTKVVSIMKSNANKYNIDTINIYVQPGTYANQILI